MKRYRLGFLLESDMDEEELYEVLTRFGVVVEVALQEHDVRTTSMVLARIVGASEPMCDCGHPRSNHTKNGCTDEDTRAPGHRCQCTRDARWKRTW